MSVTFNWVVTDMYTMPTPTADYVSMVRYNIQATDDANNTVSMDRMTDFPVDPSQNTYIAYANLTPQIVLSWVQEDTNLVNNIQSSLEDRLNRIVNPPILPTNTPVPWTNYAD